MICSKCNQTTNDNVESINNNWLCDSCKRKNFFSEIKELYNNAEGKKILLVSSKVERLDEASDFILKDLDIFSLKNTVILVHAEGIPHVHYEIDVAFVDMDLVCWDYHLLIPGSPNYKLNWVDSEWNLHDKYL